MSAEAAEWKNAAHKLDAKLKTYEKNSVLYDQLDQVRSTQWLTHTHRQAHTHTLSLSLLRSCCGCLLDLWMHAGDGLYECRQCLASGGRQPEADPRVWPRQL